MKILSSNTTCSKPVWVSFFWKTQKKIFWTMFTTKQLTVAIGFHSILLHTMKVNSDRQLFGYQRSSNSLCSTAEINVYRFGAIWVWVNDRIFISLLCSGKRLFSLLNCSKNIILRTIHWKVLGNSYSMSSLQNHTFETVIFKSVKPILR